MATPGLARLGLSCSASRALEGIACSRGPVAALESLVSSSQLHMDSAQAECASKLQALWEAAHAYSAMQAAHISWQRDFRQRIRDARASSCSDLHARRELMSKFMLSRPERPTLQSRGLYLWGGVGRGKSLLMDIFATSLQGTERAELTIVRQHYHEFMHSLHQRLHALRQIGAAREAVAIAAAEINQGCATVLCLDEFQVTSISDAVILKSLFEGLMSNNVMVVTTSNRPPEDLYKNGLNHMLYMPSFIKLLESQVGVHHIDTPEDYREIKATSAFASGSAHSDFMVITHGVDSGFQQIVGANVNKATLSVAWGREMKCSNVKDGVACFSFADICGSPLSAEDYLALVEANKLHTIAIAEVPRFTAELHNEARRFTNLVDCLYEHHCRLLCTAACPPEELMEDMVTIVGLPTGPQVLSDCSAGMTDIRVAELDLADARLPQPNAYAAEGGSGVMGVMSAASASLEETGFAAKRCISRIREMGTEEYRAAHRAKWGLSLHPL